MATEPSTAAQLNQLIDETSVAAHASLSTYTSIAKNAAKRLAGEAEGLPTTVADDLQSAMGTMAADAVRAMATWTRVFQLAAQTQSAAGPTGATPPPPGTEAP